MSDAATRATAGAAPADLVPTRPRPGEGAIRMAHDPADDATLLLLLQQRDVRALEHLYDRHGRLAYGLAYRILNDATAAEDVVQEAFLNIWRQAPSYDARRGTVRTWLLSIVHHRAIDFLRSRANRKADVQIDAVERTLAVPDVWQTVSAKGLPLSTVKGRMRMAMQKLRTLLESTNSWATG
jgi:DNA-directed RNA polymerase specialized sigma24 family protein